MFLPLFAILQRGQQTFSRTTSLQMISSVEIFDKPTFSKTVRENAGKKVTVEIYRNGKKIIKEVMFNNPS